MTREESIECLNYQNEKFFGGQSEALKMAISALSELGTKANEAIKPYVELAHSVSAEGEYIKKEDIVKYIDNMPSELTEDGRRMVRLIRLKEFVADLPTYSFPEREKGEWIPVTERLPEIHQDVLLELRSGEMLTGFKAETEPYFYCHGVDGCYVEPQNVLAWQPLPEPYKKGGE